MNTYLFLLIYFRISILAQKSIVYSKNWHSPHFLVRTHFFICFPHKKTTLKSRIEETFPYCTDCPNGPKHKNPFLNLAVDLSIYLLFISEWNYGDSNGFCASVPQKTLFAAGQESLFNTVRNFFLSFLLLINACFIFEVYFSAFLRVDYN